MKAPVLHSARLEAIFISAARGLPMRRVSEVEAIAGSGLSGDRYQTGKGYYSRADPCQVTLIETEALEIMQALFRVRVSCGEHRRNLVTSGVPLRELAGWTFRIGEVRLLYERPRPPCGYLERITQKGMTRALGEGAGICAQIQTSGWIREGDAITLGEQCCRPRRLP